MIHKRTKPNAGRNYGRFPIYPLLFGVYPVLALTAYNISQIDLYSTYRSFTFSVVFAFALFGILRLIMRNWFRAAFLSLLLLLLFYSYGHVYTLIKAVTIFGVALGRHRLLLLAWAALAGLAVWISTRKSINIVSFAFVLNIVSACLLVFPVYQIIQYEVKHQPSKPNTMESNSSANTQASHQPYPDIYYIILDAYGRADTLQEVFNYDNSTFLNDLTERGFYIANCSLSNYGYTELSLGSSLNLDYLDKFITTNYDHLIDIIQTNAAREFLKAHEYTIVSFETGYRWTQWEDADVYLPFQKKFFAINEYEVLFLETTLLRAPMDYKVGADLAKQPVTFDSIHHDRIIYDLETLKDMPGIVNSPKFVFVHLVIPHPPDVFGPNGELVPEQLDQAGQITGYRNAVIFINQQMLQVVDGIIAKSKTPPIIVIQGDHGPFLYSTPTQHMAILNAYYLPGVTSSFYPSISPVNTFRLIFDSYFGQKYPLLQDVSRYSPQDNRWNFEVIPNECKK